MNKIDYIIDLVRSLKEDSPTMSVGTGESSLGYNVKNETPPVHRNKKYIYFGKGSRKKWMK